MITHLNQVARVRIGSPFRERILHDPRGKYLVVQGKDVGSDGTLILDGMARIADAPNKGAADTLSAGEVVFQSRGLSYRAAIVPGAASPMIAAGSLFILTPDSARIIPEYLVFFLNLPATQSVLRQLATGSTIPNLRRSAIEQLEVPLPSLADQNQLVALSRLVRRQADIEQRLNILRLQELYLLTVTRATPGLPDPARPKSKKSGEHNPESDALTKTTKPIRHRHEEPIHD